MSWSTWIRFVKEITFHSQYVHAYQRIPISWKWNLMINFMQGEIITLHRMLLFCNSAECKKSGRVSNVIAHPIAPFIIEIQLKFLTSITTQTRRGGKNGSDSSRFKVFFWACNWNFNEIKDIRAPIIFIPGPVSFNGPIHISLFFYFAMDSQNWPINQTKMSHTA